MKQEVETCVQTQTYRHFISPGLTAEGLTCCTLTGLAGDSSVVQRHAQWVSFSNISPSFQTHFKAGLVSCSVCIILIKYGVQSVLKTSSLRVALAVWVLQWMVFYA